MQKVFSNNPCISEYAEKEKPNNNICKTDIATDEVRCYVLVNNTYEIKILIKFELHIKIILKAFYICKKSLLRKTLFLVLYVRILVFHLLLTEFRKKFLFIWKW